MGREGDEGRKGGGRDGEGGKGGRGREGERGREEGMYTRLLSSDSTGFVLCLLSLGCGVVLGLFDKRAERITRRKEEGSGTGRERRGRKGGGGRGGISLIFSFIFSSFPCQDFMQQERRHIPPNPNFPSQSSVCSW